MKIPLVEGWTGPIEWQLFADGVAVDLTGTTDTLVLRDKAGTVLALTGTFTVFGVTTGKVRYSPGAAELLASKSPYGVRVKVRDAASKDVFFPNAEPDVWELRV